MSSCSPELSLGDWQVFLPKKLSIVFKLAQEASGLTHAKVNNFLPFLLAFCKTKKYLGRSKTATHIVLGTWRIFKSTANNPEFWKWSMIYNEKSSDHQKTKPLSPIRAQSRAKHVFFHNVASSVETACWTGQSLGIFLHWKIYSFIRIPTCYQINALVFSQ